MAQLQHNYLMLTHQISTVTPSLHHKIDDRMGDMEKLLMEKMDSMACTLQKYRQTPKQIESISGTEKPYLDGTQAMLPPLSKSQGQSYVDDLFDVTCSCSSSHHQSSCSRSLWQKTTVKTARSLLIFNHLLKFEMTISYRNQAVLSSLSVQPNFTVRTMVAAGSPAFLLVEQYFGYSFAFNETAISHLPLSVRLKTFWVKLQQVYAEGNGWPKELDEHRGSILSVSHSSPDLSYIHTDQTSLRTSITGCNRRDGI